jgi:RHS repeat-associated protein
VNNGEVLFNGTIDAIYHPEGRATYQGMDVDGNAFFYYEYSIKDHLGNTRLTFRDVNSNDLVDDSEILQQSHYYPFGMEMEGSWSASTPNKYLYNGKELNREHGLDWLDYGARWYDPAVGRWWSVDPLAQDFGNKTPYNYTNNNPLIFIDPDGMAADWYPEYDETTEQINLVAEEGDNEESLKEWSNGSFSDEEVSNLYGSMDGGKINMSNTFVGQFAEAFKADKEGCQFNCFSTVLGGQSTTDGEVEFNTVSERDFKATIVKEGYQQAGTLEQNFGSKQPFKTINVYEQNSSTPEVINHVSLSAGKDRRGNEYILTKDGPNEPVRFQKGNDFYKQKPDKTYK